MDTKWSLIVVVAYLLNLVNCELELKITKGKIKGQILKSRDGRPYYSYTGIPYAKPPIGDLRFKAPESVESWNGTLDATKESIICIQIMRTDGHEDCLYLNVYSPKTNKKSLPVMFFIFGGGFSVEHSGSSMYGPEYFMDKDVVLVTVNYRLGIFGYISTEDDVIPGNYGMKDQVKALRWVQENIVEFNGNPNQVTIFGGSSGAACTGHHLLSPMSKGLFHKAILQSGSPTCKWAVSATGVARKRAFSLATLAGCYVDTSEDVLNCLKRLPAKYLTDLHTKLHSWLEFPFVLFNPVVENCNSGQHAFLCHHPIYDFKQESFVPTMVGLNSAEGGMYVSFLYNETSLVYTEFRSYFSRMFSIISCSNHYLKPNDINRIGEEVIKKYFPKGEIDDNSHLDVVKMFSDSVFVECVLNVAYRLSSPVYSYFYNYQNEFSYNSIYKKAHNLSIKRPLGVTHGDELTSLFKMTCLNPNNLNEKDLEVSKLMVNIWYKFATSEHITIDGSENGLPWPKFTQSNQIMVHVNSSYPGFIKNPFVESYDFWNKLYNSSKRNY